VGGPHLVQVLVFGAFCVAMEDLMRYTRCVAVLKWTTLLPLAQIPFYTGVRAS
jgi:hypothetical protein